MKFIIRYLANILGFEISQFVKPNERRLLAYMRDNGIEVCLDIGANTGQFAQRLRKIGYKGLIISFEPQKEAYGVVKSKSARDSRWEVYNFALGNTEGFTDMHISKNSVSSSILKMNPVLEDVEPASQYTRTERVRITTLDNFLTGAPSIQNKKVFLKADTQGFEKEVLAGASKIMNQVHVLQLEMSCVELYKDEMLFDDMKRTAETWGFELFSIADGFYDRKTLKLLQVEGIFVR